MQLSGLPAPDMLEFNLPKGNICVITDDGTPLTIQLAEALSKRHWPVVLLPLPNVVLTERPPLPADVTTLSLASPGPDGLTASLAAVLQDCGPIAAFIHLHPPALRESFSAEEKALVKHLFFLAKQLKRPLHEAAQRGRSCFLTVTRLDGRLGLGGTCPFGVIGGGLFGLTKTLALEWPDVFCRAVDVSPDLSTDRAVEVIVAELHDPNRLIVETGWDILGRVTLRA